ncbi:MAG: UDP-3-O-(3-hydroxymyristoyl)glucosamine N-acyltransferase [Candidatus Omnitrophica bacterium]|nr:UDP-3-O-(3-hydroxymyristoyl)glucosamine N-acyltransferase [Candidatus Omnitrophota bacterium]
MQKTVAEIAQLVQGKVIGDGKALIFGVTSADTPLPNHVAFLEDPKRLAELEETKIACLIVPKEIQSSKKPMIQVEHPKLAWAQLLNLFFPPRGFPGTISDKAFIASSAHLGNDVTIESFAYIGDEARVGAHSVIRAYSYVDHKVAIGENTVIHPHVMLYENTVVGSRCIIHSGSVIGSDGFGYVPTPKGQIKVPQVGNVIIEDEVEIGACSAIDRATIGSTRICRGAKIDNLVQIAHNVVIGPHTVISAQTGISGSSKVGSFVTMGGRVGLADHVEIGDQAILGAQSGVPTGKKVPPKQVWIGAPARPYQEVRKQVAAQLRSAEMLDEIRKLRARVEELQKQIEGQGASAKA